MEIGLVYSSKDPRQREARNFVWRYVQERGILARIVEEDRPVQTPTVIVNGRELTDLRSKPRGGTSEMFPSLEHIAKALEEHVWCL